MTEVCARILLLVEHDNNKVDATFYHVVAAALRLSQDITACVIGSNCGDVATQVSKISGITEVIVFDAEQYKDFLPEYLSTSIFSIASNYDYFLAAATVFGKNILPRLAAMLDVAPLANVTAIIAANIFERPIYCGDVIETVEIFEVKKVLTIRPFAFDIEERPPQVPCQILLQSTTLPNFALKILETHSTLYARPNLNVAKVVVAGGRALQSRENFSMLEELALLLQAGLGATRAAVDLGYADGSCQIGQTGVVVAPKIYIGVGISGAMQHIVGMQDSKIIIAINKDENAPLFKIAHYGLIGDLFELVPQITALLKS
jgi:electron transfer flavoprotein alpha subunit